MTTSADVTGPTEAADPADPASLATDPAAPAPAALAGSVTGPPGQATVPAGTVADPQGRTDPSTVPGRAGTHHGVFISFEGGDGVGKTTQLTRLAEALAAAGTEVVVTREPGGTDLGSDVRRLLLHGGHVDPRAEALLYAADRAHHVATLVRPALECGAVVLTDRYLDSSVAYQGAARSLGPQELRDLSLWATGGLLPDLTILLDAEPDLAARRAVDRGTTDRLEQEGSGFRAALREQFLSLAACEPERFAVIDAARSVEDVAEDVASVVSVLLSSRQAAAWEQAGAGSRPAEARPAAGGRPAVSDGRAAGDRAAVAEDRPA